MSIPGYVSACDDIPNHFSADQLGLARLNSRVFERLYEEVFHRGYNDERARQLLGVTAFEAELVYLKYGFLMGRNGRKNLLRTLCYVKGAETFARAGVLVGVCDWWLSKIVWRLIERVAPMMNDVRRTLNLPR
jgi:hypothetical protein